MRPDLDDVIREELEAISPPVRAGNAFELVARRRARMRRDRRMPMVTGAAALVIIVVAAGLLATGGVEVSELVDPATVVAAAERTQAGTARMTSVMVTTMSGPDGEPFESRFETEGVYDFANQRGRAFMSFTGQMPGSSDGYSASCTVVQDGTTSYWAIPAEQASQFGGKQWVRQDVESSGTSPGQSMGPADPFGMIPGITEVRREGRETVRDVPTTRYSGVFDVAGAGDRIPEESREQIREAFAQTGVRHQRVELWIDDDGLLRRFRLPMEMVPGTGGDGFSMRIDTVTEFYDFGVAVDVTPPAPEEVYVPPDAGSGSGPMMAGPMACIGTPGMGAGGFGS